MAPTHRAHPITLVGVISMACLAGCESSEDAIPAEPVYQGRHVTTLEFGSGDNSEVIKLLPDGTRAVLVASKTRKVTLLDVSAGGLTELRSANLFADDTSESEFTHIDFDSQARFAAVTRTRPITDGAGALVDCQGSLVFVDVSDSDAFGAVLAELPVGPMPDAVDISPDDGWVVTADEKDFDEKCAVEGVEASISLIELPGADPAAARIRARVDMTTGADEARREPEQIIFAEDNDTVAATLQDSHEVLIFSRAALLAGAGDDVAEVSAGDLTVVRLPDADGGHEPWPDGVDVFTDAGGVERLIVTGEYNDLLYTLALDGTLLGTAAITPEVVPEGFPRAASPAAFRPDSVSTFTYDGAPYAAISLKHSGAVGVWDLSDPAAIHPVSMVKVGAGEEASKAEESTLGTEGISAHDSGLIVTANEDESSASLVAPLD